MAQAEQMGPGLSKVVTITVADLFPKLSIVGAVGIKFDGSGLPVVGRSVEDAHQQRHFGSSSWWRFAS